MTEDVVTVTKGILKVRLCTQLLSDIMVPQNQREWVSPCAVHKAYSASYSKVYSAAAEERLLHNSAMKVLSFGMICVRIR